MSHSWSPLPTPIPRDGHPAPVRIALDAMGGDFAPACTVEGAILAARGGGVAIQLVGVPEAIERELARHHWRGLPLEIVESEGAVPEGGSPVELLRSLPRAAVAVATERVRAGLADAVVSLGNTGASVICGARVLGLIAGVRRCATGEVLIGLAPRTYVIDLGPNVEPRAEQFVEFALLGVAYCRAVLGIPEPTVAILSNGAEEGKGNRLVKEAYALLKASGLPFVGAVEGHDLLGGRANVVVCDGFTGNVLTKFAEGLGVAVADWLERELRDRLGATDAAALAARLRALLGPIEERGGVLLGVRGAFVMGHGRAGAREVAAIIEHAVRVARSDLLAAIAAEVARVRPVDTLSHG